MTEFEKSSMTCREIDLEIAKTQGFVDHVKTESEFSGRDVLAILGDFGIGNAMEKTSALKSATDRIKQLNELKRMKSCN